MKELYEVSKPKDSNLYDNPGKLFAEIFGYFKWAKENERPFTIQGVQAFLGISVDIWGAWKAEEIPQEDSMMRVYLTGLKNIIAWTELIISEDIDSYCCIKIDRKSPTKELFEITKLKFKENGEYADPSYVYVDPMEKFCEYFKWAKENERPFTLQGAKLFLEVSTSGWAEKEKEEKEIIEWAKNIIAENNLTWAWHGVYDADVVRRQLEEF